MQFLNSAWMLSQSPTIANRLAQVYEKQGQTEKARHLYALSIAAAGTTNTNNKDKQDSVARLAKLSSDPASSAKPADPPPDPKRAKEELIEERTVKLSQITTKPATARINLVFDSSPRPERADFAEGDESLRPATSQLREKDFPIRFPDVSSIKIIRQANLTCTASACTIELFPIDK
jgi:hypothetical protein